MGCGLHLRARRNREGCGQSESGVSDRGQQATGEQPVPGQTPGRAAAVSVCLSCVSAPDSKPLRQSVPPHWLPRGRRGLPHSGWPGKSGRSRSGQWPTEAQPGPGFRALSLGRLWSEGVPPTRPSTSLSLSQTFPNSPGSGLVSPPPGSSPGLVRPISGHHSLRVELSQFHFPHPNGSSWDPAPTPFP